MANKEQGYLWIPTNAIYDEFTELPISRQLKYQRRMKAKGRCIKCGKEANKGVLCDEHRRRDKKRRDQLKNLVNEVDYPNEENLNKIKKWESDWYGLMEFVGSIWYLAEWGFKRKENIYYLSTAGWSGNEEIMEALQSNTMFWMCCWYKSRRGGHYVFKIRNVKSK